MIPLVQAAEQRAARRRQGAASVAAQRAREEATARGQHLAAIDEAAARERQRLVATAAMSIRKREEGPGCVLCVRRDPLRELGKGVGGSGSWFGF